MQKFGKAGREPEKSVDFRGEEGQKEANPKRAKQLRTLEVELMIENGEERKDRGRKQQKKGRKEREEDGREISVCGRPYEP